MDFSARGSLGLRLRRLSCCSCLGLDLQAILVHVEFLLPVQPLHKLPRGLANRSGKIRRVHLDRRFHPLFVSIQVAEFHRKRFHAPDLPFLRILRNALPPPFADPRPAWNFATFGWPFSSRSLPAAWSSGPLPRPAVRHSL